MPCKRSSAAPIPFGFWLLVARSRRFALPVTARSALCGFVPLRQSRRNAQRAWSTKHGNCSAWRGCADYLFPAEWCDFAGYGIFD